jgi:hypothetical protein
MELNDILNAPVPAATSTYAPVAHSAIHNKIMDCINKNGFMLTDTAVKAKRSDCCIVNYKLKDLVETYDLSNDMGIRIGWKNSYNKTVSFGFAIGSEVFICTNGMVHGEYTIKKQHRQNGLENYVTELIEKYFENIRESHNENVKFAKYLMGRQIDENEARRVIGQLFIDSKILNNTQLRTMSDQLYTSDKFANFTDNKVITAWDLYNHGTEALKSSAVVNDFTKHENFNKFFIEKF